MELNWPLIEKQRSTKKITFCDYHENATLSRAQQILKLEWRFPAATDPVNARGLSLAKSISDVDRDFVSRLSTH
jgi:hypothetical protein